MAAGASGEPAMFSDPIDHPDYVPVVVTCSACGRTQTLMVPKFLQDASVQGWTCRQCTQAEDRARTRRIDDALDDLERGEIPPPILSRIFQDICSLHTTTC